jgi:hypothetical protein
MLSMSFVTALAVMALFFQGAGATPSSDSPPECASTNLLRSIIVGLLSGALKAIPAVTVRYFHKRKFHKKKGGWSDSAKRREGAYLRCVDRLQISFMLVFNALLTFFFIVFLANITMSAQGQLVVAFITDCLWSVIIFPILLSVLHVVLADFLIKRDLNLLSVTRLRFTAPEIKADDATASQSVSVAKTTLNAESDDGVVSMPVLQSFASSEELSESLKQIRLDVEHSIQEAFCSHHKKKSMMHGSWTHASA